ncbi:HEPN family nuclease [Deinococcus sp. Marseille-Q6407]|uniref:HEPN family nuclease n=1 Tax=Deinococcus sp. Marseille-Q6407 TaxID=2969223 RepID=UPI0021BEE2F3|nr:HEPN family nuclease [Deinococcus sp. Marseille-Q6407]
MEFEPGKTFTGLAQRTLANIDTIDRLLETEKIRRGEFYEVTLLVNSLLSLIIFLDNDEYLPKKRLETINIQDFGPTSLNGLANANLKNAKIKTLRELVKQLRNSVAHASIEFDSEPVQKQITAIIFKGILDKKKPEEVWSMRMTQKQVMKFVRMLVWEIEEHTRKRAENYSSSNMNPDT